MIGLAVAVLVAAGGKWRAVSVMIACSTPMGLLGMTLSATYGGGGGTKVGYSNKASWSHGMLLLTMETVAGWKLMQENW